ELGERIRRRALGSDDSQHLSVTLSNTAVRFDLLYVDQTGSSGEDLHQHVQVLVEQPTLYLLCGNGSVAERALHPHGESEGALLELLVPNTQRAMTTRDLHVLGSEIWGRHTTGDGRYVVRIRVENNSIDRDRLGG